MEERETTNFWGEMRREKVVYRDATEEGGGGGELMVWVQICWYLLNTPQNDHF